MRTCELELKIPKDITANNLTEKERVDISCRNKSLSMPLNTILDILSDLNSNFYFSQDNLNKSSVSSLDLHMSNVNSTQLHR